MTATKETKKAGNPDSGMDSALSSIQLVKSIHDIIKCIKEERSRETKIQRVIVQKLLLLRKKFSFRK